MGIERPATFYARPAHPMGEGWLFDCVDMPLEPFIVAGVIRWPFLFFDAGLFQVIPSKFMPTEFPTQPPNHALEPTPIMLWGWPRRFLIFDSHFSGWFSFTFGGTIGPSLIAPFCWSTMPRMFTKVWNHPRHRVFTFGLAPQCWHRVLSMWIYSCPFVAFILRSVSSRHSRYSW